MEKKGILWLLPDVVVVSQIIMLYIAVNDLCNSGMSLTIILSTLLVGTWAVVSKYLSQPRKDNRREGGSKDLQ